MPGTSYQLDPVMAAFNIGTIIRWLKRAGDDRQLLGRAAAHHQAGIAAAAESDLGDNEVAVSDPSIAHYLPPASSLRISSLRPWASLAMYVAYALFYLLLDGPAVVQYPLGFLGTRRPVAPNQRSLTA